MRELLDFRARGTLAAVGVLLLSAVIFLLILSEHAALAQSEEDTEEGSTEDLAAELGLEGLSDDLPEPEEGAELLDVDSEETGAPEPSAGTESERDIRAQDMTLWQQFKQSGTVGFIILLLEIAVLTLIIEAFINVNVNKVLPTELTLDLEGKLEDNSVEEAIETCYENPGIMTNVVRAGLEAPKGDLNEAKDNIEMAGDLETDNFLHRINFLSVFATIAPMLGLLGTVIGMVYVFGQVASEAALGKPEQLAKGINMALLTTEYGLIVGIPAMFMYYYFKIRANKILLAVETGAKGLVKWRMHNKGIPPLGLFPNKILLGIEEALSDSFVGLFPFVGFFLGPLSVAKGLRVKDEVSSAMESIPSETAGDEEGREPDNPGSGGDADVEKGPKKLVITPEVSANLWKASAAIFIGIAGIIISFVSLALFILAVFFNFNLITRIFGAA